ncbi:nicotinate-nucleotide--dimethylbenzimidazole phosphoribosyltransferase [Streptomyces sp. NPDC006879]|uniref:nicotinate-nucleotide--dimethylbenzimidazole phosphoribosyltransferase n=1 Tax=Streptomyces sp. NPDC006879 TaxID=3364767 RepID=UPI0036A27773
MTDTGQVPGEGLPDSTGMVDQPGIPGPTSGFVYLDTDAEEEELLLMPSGQGSWSDPQVVPVVPPPAAEAHAPQEFASQPAPPAEAHETGGRDAGALDLGAVRTAPEAPVPATPLRRPLHMGPPMPEAGGGVVRSLADRGPAAPPTPSAPMSVAGAQSGPEATEQQRETVPAQGGPHTGEVPPQPGVPWDSEPQLQTALPQVSQAPVAEPSLLVAQAQPVSAPQAGAAQGQPGVPQMPVGAFVPIEASLPSAGQAAPVLGEPAPAPLPEAAAEPAAEPAPETTAAPVDPESPPGESIPFSPADPPVVIAPPAAAADEAPAAARVVEAVAEPLEEAAPVDTEVSGAEPDPSEAVPTAPEPVASAPAEAPEGQTPVAPPTEQRQQPEVIETALEAEAPAPAQPTVAAPETRQPQQPSVVVEEPPTQPADPAASGTPTPPAGVPLADLLVSGALPKADQVPVVEAAPIEPEPVPAPQEQPRVASAEEPAAPAPVEATATTEDALDAPEGAPAEPLAPQEVERRAAAPGYDEAERDAVLRVMRERRDIRNGFRADPIPHEVLLRVLEAAHTAPSVGHSQPWDFVVIRSGETRRAMHELATRQREAYAKSLPKGRAKQFKEMKIEAILDTPVNIVVTADPTRGGRHTLGRHTQPQMAPYSSALAVENLWLAARAEGLGVGWVSFFDEREMVRALGLPEHLEVVAYLCVGYVDEFPEEPELMQAGWSKRRPLSWVVHEETYGRRALPGEEPHSLLSETVANIRPLDAKALGEAWERQKRMTKPAGALGMLEIISAQLSGLSRVCPPPVPEPAAVAIFAGDHGVHAQGVTAWPQEVTSQMVANFLGGGAVCNAFANQVGAEVCVVDVGVAGDLPATPGLLPRKVRPGTSDLTAGPAMSREEAVAAIEVGIETARDLVAAGNKALLTGEMGIANTTVSAALISVFTGADPTEVTGRGTGINDEMHDHKVDVVRRALELHRPDPADPIGVLAAVGGLEHAALVGLILGGASLRTPVILDGVSAGAAALVARAIAPEALAACIAGHRSAEPGHVAALTKLGLRPLVDLDLRLGEGTGALLALPLVQSAARAMHEVATFDSAGVTEK